MTPDAGKVVGVTMAGGGVTLFTASPPAFINEWIPIVVGVLTAAFLLLGIIDRLRRLTKP